MTESKRVATLNLPDARIHYETRGAGPLLLLIPGGPQDAGVFTQLGRQLADRYTVVAYDPRGNSRSTGAPGLLILDQHGDDAAALIQALAAGPAHVFGTSGGAHVGLNLAARHPERVNVLVAHEPPSMMLLPDSAAEVAAARELHDIYRRQGVDAAMAKFFGDNGLADPGDAQASAPAFEPSPEDAETFARVSANFEAWLAHGLLPLSFYRPDVARLRAGRPRVVVGIGDASAGQPIERMARALADNLGSDPVRFPGDHLGFEQQPEAFAATLHEVLTSGRPRVPPLVPVTPNL